MTLERFLARELIRGIDPNAATDSLAIVDISDWIETNFFAPETKGPIYLQEYQKRCLRHIFSRDSAGNLPYSTVVWSDIKKSIKSTIAAAVGLYMAWHIDWGSIKVVANDLKQADSRVSFYMRRSIELNPEMKEAARVKPSGYTITLPNNARIEALPIDPKGEAGGNDDLIIFSELWAANTKASEMMWTEMTLSPTKHGKSMRWVETYAGHSGEAPILEKLYEDTVKPENLLPWANEFDPPLPVYADPRSRHFVLWNDSPRSPWQTHEYYATESTDLRPEEYQRIHQNKWTSSVGVFVPGEWWDACKQPAAIPELTRDLPAILAADAAITGDCFGLYMLTGVGGNDVFHTRYARAWYPPSHGEIDWNDVEREIRRLISTYNIVEFVYDPYQLYSLAKKLSQDLIVHIFPFQQGQARAIADKALHDRIRERRLLHSGEPDLDAHIKNANAKTEDEKTMRIIKRNDAKKIDLAVCASMASDRAAHWQL
jgi:phage terminase large subunit-like protein